MDGVTAWGHLGHDVLSIGRDDRSSDFAAVYDGRWVNVRVAIACLVLGGCYQSAPLSLPACAEQCDTSTSPPSCPGEFQCGHTSVCEDVFVDPLTGPMNSMWTVTGSAVEGSTGLVVTLPMQSPTGSSASLQLNSKDLTNNAVQVEFSQPSNIPVGAAMFMYAEMGDNDAEAYRIGTDGTHMSFDFAGSGCALINGTSQCAYVGDYTSYGRIRHREDSNTVYLDSSSDGSTWTTQFSHEASVPVGSLSIVIGLRVNLGMTLKQSTATFTDFRLDLSGCPSVTSP
jgi:hypothetical protein